MIRSRDGVVSCVEAGHTLAKQALFDDPRHFRWAVVDTGETVFRSAISRAVDAGKLSVLQRGMFGEPIQYGRA